MGLKARPPKNPNVLLSEEAHKETLLKLGQRSIELFNNREVQNPDDLPHHFILKASQELNVPCILDGVGSRVWDKTDDEWYWEENEDSCIVIELVRDSDIELILYWNGDDKLEIEAGP